MYEYTAYVDRVVDGDTYDMTIDLGFDITMKQRIRINAVDCPETWQPDSEAEKEHGLRATEEVKNLIEGKKVRIHTYKVDKWGRYVCDVYIGNINLAGYLIVNDLIKRDSY
jgi:micrococcal nuclease